MSREKLIRPKIVLLSLNNSFDNPLESACELSTHAGSSELRPKLSKLVNKAYSLLEVTQTLNARAGYQTHKATAISYLLNNFKLVYTVSKVTNYCASRLKSLNYVITSNKTSQPFFSYADRDISIIRSLTGRKSLLNLYVFRKSLKKSPKAYKAIIEEMSSLPTEKASVVLKTKNLRLPIKKLLRYFYSFKALKPLKKSIVITYVIVSPGLTYSLVKGKRLRRVRKRLRKRTLRAFKKIPY